MADNKKGLTAARRNVTMAQTALQSTCDAATLLIEQWKMKDDTIHQQVEIIEDNKTRLQTKIERLEATMDTLDEKTGDPTEEAEIEKYDEYAKKTAEVMAEANNAMDEMLVELRRRQRRINSIAQAENMFEQAPTQQQQQVQGQAQIIQIGQKLLDLPEVPIFTGKPWEYQNFITMFDTVVDSSSQNDLCKLNHLLDKLKGDAKEAIYGIQLKEENYKMAKDILKERFGNKEKAINCLNNRLIDEQAKSGSTRDQKYLLNRVKVTVNQLADYEEPIETRQMKNTIIKKFQQRVIDYVGKQKAEKHPEGSDTWTITVILSDIEKFLKREEELNEFMGRKDNSDHWNKDQSSKKNDRFSKKKSSDNDSKKKYCIFCKEEGHWGQYCSEVSSTKERSDMLKAENRCLKCMKKGHSTSECKFKPCSNCEKDHHVSICFAKKKDENSNQKKKEYSSSKKEDKDKQKSKTTAVVYEEDYESENQESAEFKSEEKVVATTRATKKKGSAFIPTCKIDAFNPKENKWEKTSIMMDTGSDETYISKELMDRWELPSNGEETVRIRTFGSKEPSIKTYFTTEIMVKIGEEEKSWEVYATEDLAGKIAKPKLSKEDMMFVLKNKIDLNEDSLEEKVEPHILLGCDYMTEFINGDMITLPSGLKLMGTEQGYTTIGSVPGKGREKSDIKERIQFMVLEEAHEDPQRKIEDEQKMDTKMKEDNEFTGPVKEEKSEKDKEVVQRFEETVEKRGDKYYARLPFKKDHPPLPDNWSICIKRLESIKRQYSGEILQMVEDVFQDYLDQGFMEEVNKDQETKNLIHYNPILPVITPMKSTTKCRLTVDGSSHFKNEPSLVDIIEQGPVILPDLVDMMTRFRAGKTAIVSDVEKAFLQVYLHEDDRDVTRVLWLKDFRKPVTADNIRIFRSTRVIFGLNVSPFLLAATILHHLKTIPDQNLAKEIANNLYVDNSIITTDEMTEEMIKIYKTLKNIFKEMNMNLRQFLSNSQEFNQQLEEEDKTNETIMKKSKEIQEEPSQVQSPKTSPQGDENMVIDASGPFIKKKKDRHSSEEKKDRHHFEEKNDRQLPEEKKVASTVVKVIPPRIICSNLETTRKTSCVFCGLPHWSDQCFNKQKYEERKKILQEKKLCMKCLQMREEGHHCPPKKCHYCGANSHHSAMCWRPEIKEVDKDRMAKKKPEQVEERPQGQKRRHEENSSECRGHKKGN